MELHFANAVQSARPVRLRAKVAHCKCWFLFVMERTWVVVFIPSNLVGRKDFFRESFPDASAVQNVPYEREIVIVKKNAAHMSLFVSVHTCIFELSPISAHLKRNCLLGIFSVSGGIFASHCACLEKNGRLFLSNGRFFPSNPRKWACFFWSGCLFLKNEVGRN